MKKITQKLAVLMLALGASTASYAQCATSSISPGDTTPQATSNLTLVGQSLLMPDDAGIVTAITFSVGDGTTPAGAGVTYGIRISLGDGFMGSVEYTEGVALATPNNTNQTFTLSTPFEYTPGATYGFALERTTGNGDIEFGLITTDGVGGFGGFDQRLFNTTGNTSGSDMSMSIDLETAPAPASLAATTVEDNDASFSWNAVGGAIDYDWVITAAGVDPTTGPILFSGTETSPTVSTSVSGLTDTTDYDFHVLANLACNSVALTSVYSTTSFTTLVSSTTATIEFSAASSSDDEDAGGNLPSLVLDGILTERTNFDVTIDGAVTDAATLGTDYTLGDNVATTITLSVPAGNYSAQVIDAANFELASVNELNELYPSIENDGTVINGDEVFTPTETGTYEITLSAESFNPSSTGNGFVRVGTTGPGSSDVYDGAASLPIRINDAEKSKIYPVTLTSGVAYNIRSGAGGSTTITNMRMKLDFAPSANFAITVDTDVESDEVIDLTLSNAQGDLALAALTNTEYTITNDDMVLGTDAFGLNTISLYPNPAKSSFEVQGVEVSNIEVYNILGSKVITLENTNTVNVSGLNAGVYLVKVTANNASTVKKLVIK